MKKLLENELVINDELVKTIVNDVSKSKSLRMKELFELGLEIKQIAILMNVRYNFVFNVVSNYVRINDIEVTNSERNSRKNEIIELFLKGKTNTEISKLLKVNYNYVFKVLKEYKAENERKSKIAE